MSYHKNRLIADARRLQLSPRHLAYAQKDPASLAKLRQKIVSPHSGTAQATGTVKWMGGRKMTRLAGHAVQPGPGWRTLPRWTYDKGLRKRGRHSGLQIATPQLQRTPQLRKMGACDCRGLCGCAPGCPCGCR